MTWRTKVKVAAVLAALTFGAILAGFFGDKAYADTYERPLPPVVDGPTEGATAAAIVITGVFVVFVAGWLLYGWLKKRRERAEKFNAAAEALRRNKERSIARYDRVESELASAARELDDERIARTVAQWSKGAY